MNMFGFEEFSIENFYDALVGLRQKMFDDYPVYASAIMKSAKGDPGKEYRDLTEPDREKLEGILQFLQSNPLENMNDSNVHGPYINGSHMALAEIYLGRALYLKNAMDESFQTEAVRSAEMVCEYMEKYMKRERGGIHENELEYYLAFAEILARDFGQLGMYDLLENKLKSYTERLNNGRINNENANALRHFVEKLNQYRDNEKIRACQKHMLGIIDGEARKAQIVDICQEKRQEIIDAPEASRPSNTLASQITCLFRLEYIDNLRSEIRELQGRVDPDTAEAYTQAFLDILQPSVVQDVKSRVGQLVSGAIQRSDEYNQDDYESLVAQSEKIYFRKIQEKMFAFARYNNDGKTAESFDCSNFQELWGQLNKIYPVIENDKLCKGLAIHFEVIEGNEWGDGPAEIQREISGLKNVLGLSDEEVQGILTKGQFLADEEYRLHAENRKNSENNLKI